MDATSVTTTTKNGGLTEVAQGENGSRVDITSAENDAWPATTAIRANQKQSRR